MKKNILIAVITLVIVIVVVGGYMLLSNSGEKSPTNNTNPVGNNDNGANSDSGESSNGKTLIVYFSASGSTKKVAEQIRENLDADIFEIVPEEKYTSSDLDWTDENSRVSREHNDESLRNVKLSKATVDNWKDYDTVLIGYPIWWGVAAWPVDTFVKANDFTGKTVVPFCTSASSGLGDSGKLLENEAKGGNWKNGRRFSSSASSSDIKMWTDSLK